MDDTEIIWRSFENCVPHLANLDEVREIVSSLLHRFKTIDEVVFQLQDMLETLELTLRTDIRILINEIFHNMRMRKADYR